MGTLFVRVHGDLDFILDFNKIFYFIFVKSNGKNKIFFFRLNKQKLNRRYNREKNFFFCCPFN